MALFVCKVGTPDGRVLLRYCKARNRFELQESLEEEGYCVFKVRRALFSLSFFSDRGKKSWSSHRFLLFNQELLALLRSGMPILEILDSLVQETDSPSTKAVLLEIKEGVQGGASLSEAFSAFPQFFPKLYVSTIASGEKTGDLPQTILRYLAYQKRFARVRERLKSAAFYPLFLLAATFGVLLFMIFFVIPSFMQIYADAQVSLPWLTRMVLGLSSFVARGWLFILIILGLSVWLIRRFFTTPDGRRFLDKALINMPIIGILFRLSGMVNFCRTTATILASGLPLVEAMNLARGVLNNVVLQQGITNVVSSVNEGDTLGNALHSSRLFPTVALRMISTGEKTGTLPQMFEEVSEYYEADIDTRLDRLASLAEPLILLFVGLVIGGIVVAIYLPIFQLAGTVR
jgi:type IV pilus assembly protein PilC